MAKSTHSKVKRQYRAKNREEGVYAAVEDARLERLSAKLVAIRDSTKISPIGEGDSKEDLEEEERMQQVEGENNEAGSFWCLGFSLLDPDNVSYDTLDCISRTLGECPF